jgi:Flp pilus assembly pilin Flp
MGVSMNLLKNFLNRVFSNSIGATLIEMALYIALVVIVSITVVSALGGKLQSVFQTIVDSL